MIRVTVWMAGGLLVWAAVLRYPEAVEVCVFILAAVVLVGGILRAFDPYDPDGLISEDERRARTAAALARRRNEP